MKKPLSAAIALILFATAVPALAQDDTDQNRKKDKPKDAVNLEQVVVTGTRTPKAVDKIPGAINIVSPEEVKRTLTLTEDATAVLARTVPGYSESSQAMSNTGENLRGRIALRLFDGIPQGSPLREGTRNGTFTDMGIVGRIEVINGPSASEGIGAAGGIINYLSKVPTVEGNETNLVTRYSTQFADDSYGWKVGVNFARKQGDYDVVAGISRIDRGISYDGNGRRVGMNTSGSVSDSTADNLFLKGGVNFGDSGEQRLQATISHFQIEGHGDYIQVEGCRYDPTSCPVPSTNTSEKGHIFGSKAEFNDFKQYALQYSNGDLWGGTLMAQLYKADQAMRYLPENGDDKQLRKAPPAITAAERIYDQSEIDSNKKGLRTSWTRGDIFGLSGLELRTGVDLVEDEAQQRLALTNRLWVPPMDYKSNAPYAQLTWDVGPFTVSGGLRRENGKLHVDSYTTTAFRNSVFVQGGGLTYTENMKNLGGIWRFAEGWSAFVSYGEGFGLANIGIPLRNIQVPGQSVDRIKDLDPIIVKNREVGVNWAGAQGSFGASAYESKSKFGASLAIDPATNDFVLTRAPTRIRGYEANGEWRFSDEWKVTALYSHIRGKTSFFTGGELKKPMGVLDTNPDKFGWSVQWKFADGWDTTLGATTLMSRDLSGSDVNPSGATVRYEEHTHGYTLFDLGVNYDTGRWGRLSLGVENLFDKQYILSWSQVPGFQNYWAGRGRMVSLTHNLRF